jgi:hypothetical protein
MALDSASASGRRLPSSVAALGRSLKPSLDLPTLALAERESNRRCSQRTTRRVQQTGIAKHEKQTGHQSGGPGRWIERIAPALQGALQEQQRSDHQTYKSIPKHRTTEFNTNCRSCRRDDCLVLIFVRGTIDWHQCCVSSSPRTGQGGVRNDPLSEGCGSLSRRC